MNETAIPSSDGASFLLGIGLGLNSTAKQRVPQTISIILLFFSYQNTSIMGRNRVSDDADYISTDPKDVRLSKAPPPAEWPIPNF